MGLERDLNWFPEGRYNNHPYLRMRWAILGGLMDSALLLDSQKTLYGYDNETV